MAWRWNLQRVFWRESPNILVKIFVLTVVTFVLASSAHYAVRTLQECARDYKKTYPEAAKAIMECFYMVNGAQGTETVEGATILCKEVE